MSKKNAIIHPDHDMARRNVTPNKDSTTSETTNKTKQNKDTTSRKISITTNEIDSKTYDENMTQTETSKRLKIYMNLINHLNPPPPPPPTSTTPVAQTTLNGYVTMNPHPKATTPAPPPTSVTHIQQQIDKMFNKMPNEGTSEGQTPRPNPRQTDHTIKIQTFNSRMRLRNNMSLLMTEMSMDDIDVGLVIETGLTATTYRDPIIVNIAGRHGYKVISSPYLENQNSHMLFLIKKGLSTSDEIAHTTGRNLSLTINGGTDTNKTSTRIMGVYCGFNTKVNEIVEKTTKKWINKSPNNCIVLGDFNAVASNRDHTGQHRKNTGPIH